MEQRFLDAETQGRLMFDSWIKQLSTVKESTETKDQFCRVDFIVKNNNNNTFVFEVKVRNTYYPTWLLEVSKYNGILQELQDNKAKSGFYCVFCENKLYLYNILKCDISNRIKQYCPEHTVIGSRKVLKDCIMLNQSDCSIFEFTNNKWNLIQSPDYANTKQTS